MSALTRSALLPALAALVILVSAATAFAATTPPVPLSAQARIRATAGAEAYVPARMVSGYRFRIWSFTKATKGLYIRFADLRFALGTHPLYFTVAPFRFPLARCADGKTKMIQYDGNRVYANGQDAWRCIAGPRGTVKVTATGPHLPDVAWARVVASTHRIY